ncbi:ATP-dependent RecD-like DNA helicase [Virgibacillus soli]|uniref:SF1B family DNA helicase RecD2 n=1 Tax=Paracerasibacillus soli TaxID=480284 RepID=UPI0035E76A8C
MEHVEAVEQLYMKGEPLYTIFFNETEHFSIVKIRITETNTDFKEKEIVVKGYFSKLQEGTAYVFYGQFENHTKFGRQFHVHAYKTFIPDTKEGLTAYLSSDLFYGIGKKTASKIVQELGESAITQILQNPAVLDKIQGLSKDTAQRLAQKLKENQGFEQVVVYLSQYNIGMKLAQKIYQQYKELTIKKLQEDPYQLVFDIEGFGFVTADRIATQNGIDMAHPSRIGAGCVYVLQNSVQDGHVYLPVEDCVRLVLELLYHPQHPLTADDIQIQINELNKKKNLILIENKVYLPSLYYAEDGIASHMKRILSHPVENEVNMADLMKIIGEIEEEETLSYGKEQFEAINQALHAKMMILTGGPGTGKTTVIKGIVKAYAAIYQVSTDPSTYEKKTDFPFVLTAPTGRAAKRMKESTGLPAITIHRLLGWDGNEGFDKNENEPLQGKLLIVDEFSMVDTWLANHLFKAIPNDMQVLLVGDEDQLPSVGPGQVLTDFLHSEIIPYVALQDVYRQKEGSHIIQLAHMIKNHDITVGALNNDADFSFIPCPEDQVIRAITQIVDKAQMKGIDMKDVQVLAPMYRSHAGITAINQALQQLLNPRDRQKREVKAYDVAYRVGDKVIQLVNQPEDGVFNGDIGEVVAIFKENENTEQVEQLVVAFDEREVVYERSDYVNIMHAYAISIHKAQGSEFPIVILPVVSSYHRMLRKNLIYTAITRAKQSLILIGEKRAFLKGVETLDTNKRYTSLQKQLLDRIKIESKVEETLEDDDLSPYDFM